MTRGKPIWPERVCGPRGGPSPAIRGSPLNATLTPLASGLFLFLSSPTQRRVGRPRKPKAEA
jgi:hypothetical protein